MTLKVMSATLYLTWNLTWCGYTTDVSSIIEVWQQSSQYWQPMDLAESMKKSICLDRSDLFELIFKGVYSFDLSIIASEHFWSGMLIRFDNWLRITIRTRATLVWSPSCSWLSQLWAVSVALLVRQECRSRCWALQSSRSTKLPRFCTSCLAVSCLISVHRPLNVFTLQLKPFTSL